MVNPRFWIVPLTWLLLAAILVAPAIAPTARNTQPVSPRVTVASTQTIVLVGFFQAWNQSLSTPNPTITVTQGQTITIQLSSGDGAMHKFFVDVDKNGPTPDCPGPDVCSAFFPPSTTLTFAVSFAPGTYTYYCSIHTTTMLGNFVVLAPPPSPGGGGGRPLEL
jgi:hypothetical protein